jgi:hypothetical protein
MVFLHHLCNGETLDTDYCNLGRGRPVTPACYVAPFFIFGILAAAIMYMTTTSRSLDLNRLTEANHLVPGI